MAFSFKDIFRVKTETTSIKNNTVKIETKADIMFQVGKDLGEIKNGLNTFNKEIKDINKKLKEHNLRITNLEKLSK